jgi:DNA-directed RNA polymerase specialized sigma subunit
LPHVILRNQIRRRGRHRVYRGATAAGTDALGTKVTAVADSGEMCALRDTLLAEHVHLVRHIAHHLFRRRAYVNVDDLIEAGMTGLDEAMSRYGHNTGETFEAFASNFIRRAMLAFVRKANWSSASL